MCKPVGRASVKQFGDLVRGASEAILNHLASLLGIRQRSDGCQCEGQQLGMAFVAKFGLAGGVIQIVMLIPSMKRVLSGIRCGP